MTATEPMAVGDRVYWTDGEAGYVLAHDEFIIAIAWEDSGTEVYATCCGAIERIATRYPWVPNRDICDVSQKRASLSWGCTADIRPRTPATLTPGRARSVHWVW
jgi:hypothetical protein